MIKFRILIASGAFLAHTKARSYLGEDMRYDLALLPLEDAYATLRMTDIPAPHLCIVEWGGDLYQKVVDACNSMGVKILVALSDKSLKNYARQVSGYILDYVTIPFEKDELLLRVSLALGARTEPIEAGMVKIDSHLHINFATCTLRKGKNCYITVPAGDIHILKFMFDNINQWVEIPELHRLYRLRNAIEDSPKYPRYILSSGTKFYMLHSEESPGGDEPKMFSDIQSKQ